jgi:transcriptional regulator with XRE-family HTH domain
MTDTPTGPTRLTDRWTTAIDGQQLRQLRRQQGLTQVELARQAAVSPTVVTRAERRPRVSCRTRTLVRLAAALGTEPATLMTRGPASR